MFAIKRQYIKIKNIVIKQLYINSTCTAYGIVWYLPVITKSISSSCKIFICNKIFYCFMNFATTTNNVSVL